MHLPPDHEHFGVNLESALPPFDWVEAAPAPARAPEAVWYPPRARASVSRRTPAEQEEENLTRTVRRKRWDMELLMQTGDLFQESGLASRHLWIEMKTIPPRARQGLAEVGIPDIVHLVAQLCVYFRTPRGTTLASLSVLAGPKGSRHAPHAYVYVSPGRADFEELWRELVELGGVDWGTEASGWGQEELKSLLERQEIMHPSNGQLWKALGVN